MPRKEWIPQNQYCRRSKLNEYEFEALVMAYFTELLLKTTRKQIHFFYFHYGVAHMLDKGVTGSPRPLSRQAIGRYFEKMGQKLWDKIVPKEWTVAWRIGVDEFLDFMNEKSDDESIKIVLYKFLCFPPMDIDVDKIMKSFLFHLLSNRSKVIRGFKRDKFHLEFIRAYYICIALDIKINNGKLPSLSSTSDIPYASVIADRAASGLLDILRKNPM